MSKLGKNLNISESVTFDIQRRVVAHMTQTSWQTIPHVAYVYEPDITNFFAFFQEEKNNFSKNFSFNTIMLKAFAEA